MSLEKTNDSGYRAKRAEHYAEVARDAVDAHGRAKTEAEKTEYEATIAHAADRANIHARFVMKTQPGSELADKAALHAKIAKTIHDRLKAR